MDSYKKFSVLRLTCNSSITASMEVIVGLIMKIVYWTKPVRLCRPHRGELPVQPPPPVCMHHACYSWGYLVTDLLLTVLYCDVDERLSRKQGTLLHLSLRLLLEKLLWHFLFVQQEGERIREQSEEGKEDFTHPDAAACTDDRLQTGKGLLLPYVTSKD